MLNSNRSDLTKKQFRLPTGWPWWLAWSALLFLVLTSYLREVNWRTNPTTAVANNVVVSSSARFGNLPFPFQKVGANLPSSAAEEIVKTKLSQFAQSRRHLARGLADRNRQQVPLA